MSITDPAGRPPEPSQRPWAAPGYPELRLPPPSVATPAETPPPVLQ